MSKRIFTTLAMLTALAAPCFAQQRFDSADAAAQALIDASEQHELARLTAIFGPRGNAILTSGNIDQDRAEQSEFARLARGKHQLKVDQRNTNRMILYVGDEDWPFPIPIVRSNGKWSFDPSESKVEMEARRIGTDEMDAIEICAGYVEAQRKYAEEGHPKDGVLIYASHIANAAVPHGLVEATWDGQNKASKPYHGYYFRVLEGQGPHAPGGAHSYVVKGRLLGGFGLVAWPAQYGVTGIRTFIVNQNGLVYEKDIAPPPGGAPVPITRYDPDPSWKPVD